MNKVQSFISVKRARNGATYMLGIGMNNPLWQMRFQGSVTPNWEEDDSRPVLTPEVIADGVNVTDITEPKWYYQNALLNFTTDNGDYKCTASGIFGVKTLSDGNLQLKIMKNLLLSEEQQPDNEVYNQQLRYECKAKGLTLSKNVEVEMSIGSDTAYIGKVSSSNTIIVSATETATLTASLFLGPEKMSDSAYSVRWYKNDMAGASISEEKKLTVTRETVEGATTFIAQFIVNSQPVASAAATVTDAKDEYRMMYQITSAVDQIDTGKPVVVQGCVCKADGTDITDSLISVTWKHLVYTMRDGVQYDGRVVNARNVVLSTTDTDIDDRRYDANISGEVEFEI